MTFCWTKSLVNTLPGNLMLTTIDDFHFSLWFILDLHALNLFNGFGLNSLCQDWTTIMTDFLRPSVFQKAIYLKYQSKCMNCMNFNLRTKVIFVIDVHCIFPTYVKLSLFGKITTIIYDVWSVIQQHCVTLFTRNEQFWYWNLILHDIVFYSIDFIFKQLKWL